MTAYHCPGITVLLMFALPHQAPAQTNRDSASRETTSAVHPSDSRTPSSFTPNDFEGTDVERINRAIDAAAVAGCRVVIPRVNLVDGQRRDTWLIDSAILLRSDTTLELDNCHIKLSDRCRDNLMRSANCGLGITDIQPLENVHIYGVGHAVLEGADRPRATGDSGKTLGTKTYGTDAGAEGESQLGLFRTCSRRAVKHRAPFRLGANELV